MRKLYKNILMASLLITHISSQASLGQHPTHSGDPSTQIPKDSLGGYADSQNQNAQAYLAKYLAYTFWVQHLPVSPQPDFIQFIEPTTPLTQKLREKWLYLLAEKNDWANFKQYYRPTDNTGLRCYAQMARYKLNQKQEAVQDALTLWLSPEIQTSAACNSLFALLLHEHAFSSAQMEQKIAWALAHDQSAIAYELLLKLGSHVQDIKMLTLIKHNPRQILLVQPGPFSRCALSLWIKPNAASQPGFRHQFMAKPLHQQIA